MLQLALEILLLLLLMCRWEWDGEWEVDHSKRYGDTDAEGFMYATTNEKLLENIRNRCSSGANNTTSLVRRRVYVRPKICTTDAARDELGQLVTAIAVRKDLLEETMQEKRNEMNVILKYENSRDIAFSQIMIKCDLIMNSTIENVKGLVSQLQMLKQFLQDRAAVEREYARKLDQVADKFMKITSQQQHAVDAQQQQRQQQQQSLALADAASSQVNDDVPEAVDGGTGYVVVSSPDPAAAASVGVKASSEVPMDATSDTRSAVNGKLLTELENWCDSSGNTADGITSAERAQSASSSFTTLYVAGMANATVLLGNRCTHFTSLLSEGMLQGKHEAQSALVQLDITYFYAQNSLHYRY